MSTATASLRVAQRHDLGSPQVEAARRYISVGTAAQGARNIAQRRRGCARSLHSLRTCPGNSLCLAATMATLKVGARPKASHMRPDWSLRDGSYCEQRRPTTRADSRPQNCNACLTVPAQKRW